MTEITGKKGVFGRVWFQMRPSRETRLIDPIAFVGALICAPLLIAAVFCWVLFIPVFAVGFGALPYLLFGTPVYFWLLSRGEERQTRFALAGFIVNAFGALVLTASQRIGFSGAFDMFQLYIGFGSVFAPIWSAAFVWLYRSFRRDRFFPNQI
ncbi:MAG: hypothetical protein OXC60_12875 [Litoreibacter sp.]|nr:hypothetical protein [Litoreibacter sp.]